MLGKYKYDTVPQASQNTSAIKFTPVFGILASSPSRLDQWIRMGFNDCMSEPGAYELWIFLNIYFPDPSACHPKHQPILFYCVEVDNYTTRNATI